MDLRSTVTCVPLVALLLVGACSSVTVPRTISSTSPSWVESADPLDRAFVGNAAAIELHLTNLANVDTPGYRALAPLWSGPNQFDVTLDMTQGPCAVTNRSLDIFVEGPGMFRVRHPGATHEGSFAYTRGGALFIDRFGKLIVSPSGAPLDPPISVPRGLTEKDVSIGMDGTVTARIPGQTESQALGKILLFDFPNPARLDPLTDLGLYTATDASGPARQSESRAARIHAGALETANVNADKERLAIDRLKDWRAVLLARYQR